MPHITDRIYTEEEVRAFTPEEVKQFTQRLFDSTMKEVGATLPDYAGYFSDSSYDGLMGDIDLLTTVTNLNYDQGTAENLAHFLFHTDDQLDGEAEYGYALLRYPGSNASWPEMLQPYVEALEVAMYGEEA